jgi:hypothetical protein
MPAPNFNRFNEVKPLVVGTPVVIGDPQRTLPVPLTVTAIVGVGGGTVAVEYMTAHGGTWRPWPGGTLGVVAEDTTYVLSGPVTYLRAPAAVADGVLELAQ